MPTYEADTTILALDHYGFSYTRKGVSRIDAGDRIEARRLIRERLIIAGHRTFTVGGARRATTSTKEDA